LGACLVDFPARVTAAVGEPASATEHRTRLGAEHLAATFAEVPVWIFVVGTLAYPPGNPRPKYTYSAVYAAAQNLLVAATGLGLGSAFTTLHEFDEPEFRRILGIPEDRILAVSMPLGYPARGTGPVTRRPTTDVVHLDCW
jgi:nitroreductase